MPKCAISGCDLGVKENGGRVCVQHEAWTVDFMRRCVEAIETAIVDEDGLDGLAGEKLLKEAGYWPKRRGLVVTGYCSSEWQKSIYSLEKGADPK